MLQLCVCPLVDQGTSHHKLCVHNLCHIFWHPPLMGCWSGPLWDPVIILMCKDLAGRHESSVYCFGCTLYIWQLCHRAQVSISIGYRLWFKAASSAWMYHAVYWLLCSGQDVFLPVEAFRLGEYKSGLTLAPDLLQVLVTLKTGFTTQQHEPNIIQTRLRPEILDGLSR
jgi:hypothetical protein